MTEDQVKAAFDRISNWPDERRQQLAELILEIDAELAAGEYDATPDELAAIDEGLGTENASDDEVAAAFAALQRE